MEYPALEYVTKSMHSAFYPKLLGTYERELQAAIEAIIALAPDCIINVGAGEGYYSVGLAIRCPSTRLVAFEADSQAHPVLRAVADRNSVLDRIQVCGTCDLRKLAAALSGSERPVVVCDVEGYEDILLDLEAVPTLRRSWVLVELHEAAVPGVTERITRRFCDTHQIVAIQEQLRTRADYPFRSWATYLLPEYYVTFMVREHRKERMTWLWMSPVCQTTRAAVGNAVVESAPAAHDSD
jgi:predicted RNA methylase